MSDAYSWVYVGHDGREMVGGEFLVTSAFPSQSDAEAWIADTWESLADSGVAAVTLKRESEVVYGPMSLAAES